MKILICLLLLFFESSLFFSKQKDIPFGKLSPFNKQTVSSNRQITSSKRKMVSPSQKPFSQSQEEQEKNERVVEEWISSGNVQKLKETKVSPNWKSRLWKGSGLHVAAMYNQLDSARFFLDKKVNINTKDNIGHTPLHLVSFKNYEMMKLLLKNGADPNIKDNRGDTPLYNAISRYHVAGISLLLKYGADPTTKNKEGLKPVEYSRSTEINKILLKAQAEKQREKGCEPFSSLAPKKSKMKDFVKEKYSKILSICGNNKGCVDRLKNPKIYISRNPYNKSQYLAYLEVDSYILGFLYFFEEKPKGQWTNWFRTPYFSRSTGEYFVGCFSWEKSSKWSYEAYTYHGERKKFSCRFRSKGNAPLCTSKKDKEIDR